jgi:hypothetical protein
MRCPYAWAGIPCSLNQRVPGSSPGAPTNKIKYLDVSEALYLPKFGRWEGHGKDQEK